MSESTTNVTDDATERVIPTLTEAIQYLGSGGVVSVNGKTGIVNLTASDVGALPNSTVIPTVNDATFTIQKNGSTINTFTANSSTDKIANITVPTAVSELTNDSSFVTQSNVDSSISTHNQATLAHPAIRSSIDAIDAKIPTQATSTNQLADKAFVNSTIQTASANFRGSWANWAAVPTDASLYPADYTGSTTPTTNDYMVIQDASDFPVGTGETALVGTWRFKYTGNWTTVGRTGWQKEYQVNEEPLTAAQIAALNSGITATLTAQITTNTNAIANKVDKETGKGLSTNDFTTSYQTKLSGLADITTIGSGLTLQNGTLSSALTAGANVAITDNVISATDTTYSVFTGATSSAAGTSGLVPAPTTADVDKFLKGDGTWGAAGGGSSINVVQTTGTSTTDVMSQDSVTKMIYGDGKYSGTQRHINIHGDTSRIGNDNTVALYGTTTGYGVAIGCGPNRAHVTGNNGVAIGNNAIVTAAGGVSIGAYSNASSQGEFNIGTSWTGVGYNSSNYRLISGVYDGQSAHDAANVGQLNATIDAINAALSTSIAHVGASS